MNHQEKGGKSVKTTTLVLGCIAMAMLAVAFWRGRDLPAAGLMAAGRTLWRNLPILLLSFLIAGLAQVLIPKDVISRWLGTEAGIKGVLIGCVVACYRIVKFAI